MERPLPLCPTLLGNGRESAEKFMLHFALGITASNNYCKATCVRRRCHAGGGGRGGGEVNAGNGGGEELGRRVTLHLGGNKGRANLPDDLNQGFSVSDMSTTGHCMGGRQELFSSIPPSGIHMPLPGQCDTS